MGIYFSSIKPVLIFILPDTSEIDFLEDPVIKNVVVLQVVLQEVSVCSVITKAYLEGIIVSALQQWRVQGVLRVHQHPLTSFYF